jgi:hypothetical protein
MHIQSREGAVCRAAPKLCSRAIPEDASRANLEEIVDQHCLTGSNLSGKQNWESNPERFQKGRVRRLRIVGARSDWRNGDRVADRKAVGVYKNLYDQQPQKLLALSSRLKFLLARGALFEILQLTTRMKNALMRRRP